MNCIQLLRDCSVDQMPADLKTHSPPHLPPYFQCFNGRIDDIVLQQVQSNGAGILLTCQK